MPPKKKGNSKTAAKEAGQEKTIENAEMPVPEATHLDSKAEVTPQPADTPTILAEIQDLKVVEIPAANEVLERVETSAARETGVENRIVALETQTTDKPAAGDITTVATKTEASAPTYDELNEYHKLIYPWQQHVAPGYNKYYYFNPLTSESVWELPEGLQVKVTAFFALVRDNDLDRREINLDKYVDAEKKEEREKQQVDYMKRPARKQVEVPISNRFSYRQGDEIYNIWYDKFLSDDKFKEREQAPTRIDPRLDPGYTQADVYHKNQANFCIHFARGCCVLGHNCRYLHHIPTLEECTRVDQVKDVFGRTRYAKQRDDMEGVGSFLNETRTLKATEFCLVKGGSDNVGATYEALWRHFGAVGTVEDIHLIQDRCIAFVRYQHRCMAEFAKEAMTNQALESNEIMIVRWSDTDIQGHDPTAVDAKEVQLNQPEMDDRFGKGGRMKKQKRYPNDNEKEKQEEMERLNKEEEMLAKRMDAEKEYNIVNQRLEEVERNANLMSSVLKRLKGPANNSGGLSSLLGSGGMVAGGNLQSLQSW
jgi:Torus domain/WW domain/RNA recognition motif. (a.k.a. RRM, RBD, or RNP domain)